MSLTFLQTTLKGSSPIRRENASMEKLDSTEDAGEDAAEAAACPAEELAADDPLAIVNDERIFHAENYSEFIQ